MEMFLSLSSVSAKSEFPFIMLNILKYTLNRNIKSEVAENVIKCKDYILDYSLTEAPTSAKSKVKTYLIADT